jgi:hypothetical protein
MAEIDQNTYTQVENPGAYYPQDNSLETLNFLTGSGQRFDIKKIFVDKNRIDISNLSNQILISVIPTLSDDLLKKININNILTSADGILKLKYIGGCYLPTLNINKLDSTKIIAERLNKIYSEDPDQSVDFIDVMCILNAALDKPIDKSLQSKIRSSVKFRFLNILKIPVEPDEVKLGQITKELIQYVIKKQPQKNFYLNRSNFEIASEFYKHLKDFKITFELTTNSLKEIRKNEPFLRKVELYDILDKMPQRPSVGRFIEEGNLKFIII